MKVAQTIDGKQITANSKAPAEAYCPVCGGPLTLRSRSKMNNGGRTYFWRHRSNHNRHCGARNRPIN